MKQFETRAIVAEYITTFTSNNDKLLEVKSRVTKVVDINEEYPFHVEFDHHVYLGDDEVVFKPTRSTFKYLEEAHEEMNIYLNVINQGRGTCKNDKY